MTQTISNMKTGHLFIYWARIFGPDLVLHQARQTLFLDVMSFNSVYPIDLSQKALGHQPDQSPLLIRFSKLSFLKIFGEGGCSRIDISLTPCSLFCDICSTYGYSRPSSSGCPHLFLSNHWNLHRAMSMGLIVLEPEFPPIPENSSTQYVHAQ
jgi:hypothetical protein